MPFELEFEIVLGRMAIVFLEKSIDLLCGLLIEGGNRIIRRGIRNQELRPADADEIMPLVFLNLIRTARHIEILIIIALEKLRFGILVFFLVLCAPHAIIVKSQCRRLLIELFQLAGHIADIPMQLMMKQIVYVFSRIIRDDEL